MDAAREEAAPSPWTLRGLMLSMNMEIYFSSMAYEGPIQKVEDLLKPPRKRQRTAEANVELPPGTVYIGPERQPLSLRAYVQSEDWEAQMRRLSYSSVTGARDSLDSLGLSRTTSLKPWQWTGQEKLGVLARGPFRGGFLVDEVGLGKSLTALTASLRLRSEMGLKGFVLIVCPKRCTRQWFEEVQRHFQQDKRPKAIVLPAKNHQPLSTYDIVICSMKWVVRRYVDYEASKRHDIFRTWETVDKVKKLFPKVLPKGKREYGIHSSATQTLSASVLIVDESHLVKNPESLTNNAIRSLSYHYAFLLTGTPAPDRLTDLFGQMALLPGCPFTSMKHFETTIQGGLPGTLGCGEKLLVRLLAVMLIGRPKKQLLSSLPSKTEECVLFSLSDDKGTEERIKQRVKVGRWLLSSSGSTENALKRKQRAMRILRGAQLLAACPQLVDTLASLQQSAENQNISLDRGDQLDEDDSNDLDDNVVLHALDPDNNTLIEDNSSPTTGVDDSRDNCEEESDSCDDSRDNCEEESDSCDDSGDNCEEESDSCDDSKADKACHHIPRSLQIEAIQALSDKGLFSDRVCAILGVIQDILRVAPTEKIIVASQFVSFLDVLEEAMKRRQPDVPTTSFSGYLSGKEQARRLESFRIEGSLRVLFLSSTTGETGINLTMASRLVICEPAWTHGAMQQLKGRVYGLSQTKPVFIYEIIGYSSIDKLVMKQQAEKNETTSSVFDWLVRRDICPFTELEISEEEAEFY